MNVEEEWFTTEEAAAYLKISAASLRNMTSNGRVPFYKLARRNRYLKADLKNMLLNEKRGPGALSRLDFNRRRRPKFTKGLGDGLK
jgi:excisionase family DNA binding protein